jgi:putative endonuclease
MFHVYVLKSEKTGRRYIGSSGDLVGRLDRHNTGQSKATKQGKAWYLIHSESFQKRAEAVQKEIFFKTGRGRDELDTIDERSPRRQVAGSNPFVPIP